MSGTSGLLHIIHALNFSCCEFLPLEEMQEGDGVLPLEIDIADVEIGVIASFPFVNFPGTIEPIPSFEALWTLRGATVDLGKPKREFGSSDCVCAGESWYRVSAVCWSWGHCRG